MRGLKLLIADILMAACGSMLIATPLPMVSSWEAALAGVGVLLLYRACLVAR